MTALTMFFKRQAVRTLESSRRQFVIVIALVMLVSAGVVMVMSISASNQIVTYEGAQTVQPRVSALCPGEPLVYTQRIHVADTGMVDISREWCIRHGTCSLALHESYENVLLTPLDFTGTVTRTVPISPLFKPGREYEFRSGVRNGVLDVQVVPFTVREDCQE